MYNKKNFILTIIKINYETISLKPIDVLNLEGSIKTKYSYLYIIAVWMSYIKRISI